jgi:hypothetical protein
LRLTVEDSSVSDDTLRRVVLDACSHLKAIHNTLTADERHGKAYTSTVLDTGLVSVVYRLLDLILLEGVYPSLAPGVGIQPERQKRSRLCNKYAKPQKDLNVLIPILYETLNDIAFGEEGGIKSLVRDRVLIDVIAAHADVAFSPSRDSLARQTALERLNHLLEM